MGRPPDRTGTFVHTTITLIIPIPRARGLLVSFALCPLSSFLLFPSLDSGFHLLELILILFLYEWKFIDLTILEVFPATYVRELREKNA